MVYMPVANGLYVGAIHASRPLSIDQYISIFCFWRLWASHSSWLLRRTRHWRSSNARGSMPLFQTWAVLPTRKGVIHSSTSCGRARIKRPSSFMLAHVRPNIARKPGEEALSVVPTDLTNYSNGPFGVGAGRETSHSQFGKQGHGPLAFPQELRRAAAVRCVRLEWKGTLQGKVLPAATARPPALY